VYEVHDVVTIFRNNFCAHVLFMSDKCDVCADVLGSEHCCSQMPLVLMNQQFLLSTKIKTNQGKH
jgi:hypothetical protein